MTTETTENDRPAKPTPLAVNPEGIPAELRQRRQWVTWRYEWSASKRKWDKPPRQAGTGRLAESDNPATWATFEDALASYQAGKSDGVGFVFTKDDPYTGIDLDKVTPGISEQLEPWAADEVRRLASYTELSPSGMGVHVIVKATLKAGHKDTARGIEVYDRGRYFTMTGVLVNGLATIEERQAAIDDLYARYWPAKETPPPPAPAGTMDISDAALLAKARAAKNGAKFDALWRGDWQAEGYPSQSEADAALCHMLAFWTQNDAGRIDGMFRQSGLMRDKWNERHGERGTYGEITIAHAMDGTSEVYDPHHGGGNGYRPGATLEDTAPSLPAELPTVIPSAADDMPELPEAARLDEPPDSDFPWLAAYIDFSRRWSPRTFDGYHEACALFVLSTVAARRVVFHLGKPRYSNLYMALAARTSLYAKSTTTEIATATLRQAGLDWLLAADNTTPQKFISDMTPRLPEDYDALTGERKERARLRACLAGKRGWWYEEFGTHIAAMMREGGFMADFRGLLRTLDDTPERYEYGTIGRGNDVMERPYLAFLANITPADLSPFASRGAALWRDGFLARFALITPPPGTRKRDRFPREERTIPVDLSTPLRQWHERLGVPGLIIEDVKDKDGKVTGRHVEPAYMAPATIELSGKVYDAYYTYNDVLQDMIEKSARQDLDGNYARHAEKALRIALLLASMAGAPAITLQHWAKAQAIAERWRAGLHELYRQINEPEPSEAREREEKALEIVAKLGSATAADVARYMRNVSSNEAMMILDGLQATGELDSAITKRRTKRYALPKVDTVDNRQNRQ